MNSVPCSIWSIGRLRENFTVVSGLVLLRRAGSGGLEGISRSCGSGHLERHLEHALGRPTPFAPPVTTATLP
jgi:hypothetical protein